MTRKSTQHTAPAAKDQIMRQLADDALADFRRAFVAILEAQASTCATGADLAEALKQARWLNTLAIRVLGSAVLSFANDGEIPGPPAGSHAKRALALLDAEGLQDPEIEAVLLRAVLAQRSAHFACDDAHRFVDQVSTPPQAVEEAAGE